jgi:small GTP-binding protein
MVFLKNGQYELPEGLLYDINQHLFIDPIKKTIGITDVGYYFHKIPLRVNYLCTDRLVLNTPFLELQYSSKNIVLNAPCNGIIRALNPDGIKFHDYDTYTKGYLVQMDSILETDVTLIGSSALEGWVKCLERIILPDVFSFKLVIVGDNDSGKSAIRYRFVNNSFPTSPLPNNSLDMDSINLNFPAQQIYGENSADQDVRVQISLWDIGSTCPEMERSMYYAGADAVLLVFDNSNKNSFENLKKWREETEDMLSPRIPTVIIANKCDIPTQIDQHLIDQFAASHCCSVFKCSAKTGEGISQMLRQVIITLIHGLV